MIERYFGQRLPINFSRRQLMLGAARGAAGLGFLVGIGAAAAFLIDRAEYRSGSLRGDPIEGEGAKLFKTDPNGDNFAIPIRSKPTRSDNDLVGFAKVGQIVTARAYYGPTYPSYPDDLGRFEGPDGDFYGRWYRLTGVTIYKPTSLEPEGAYNVFVAGNFLKLAT